MFNLLPNPNLSHDYHIKLEGSISENLSFVLTYIPDHHLIDNASFSDYVKSLGQDLHALSHKLHAVLNNELIPRWMRIEITQEMPLKECVMIEDQQPGFDKL